MFKRIVVCCLLVLGISAVAYCAASSRVELLDGSVINGEIVSFENGYYTINTGSFGQVKIDAGKVRRIETSAIGLPQVSTGSSDANIKSQMDSVRQDMLNNPEAMKIVNELISDPKFQEMAKDPAVANAASSGNIQSLMSNEKFMGIVNNPKIKELQEKIKK
ncbi:MAG: hypothetical protein MUC39_03840 [Candidatus Omnitrophica bacterium]|jgi:hypothetical protein|nr:hypothetical protein [Candidatus Omnitrophota bacterium]